MLERWVFFLIYFLLNFYELTISQPTHEIQENQKKKFVFKVLTIKSVEIGRILPSIICNMAIYEDENYQ